MERRSSENIPMTGLQKLISALENLPSETTVNVTMSSYRPDGDKQEGVVIGWEVNVVENLVLTIKKEDELLQKYESINQEGKDFSNVNDNVVVALKLSLLKKE